MSSPPLALELGPEDLQELRTNATPHRLIDCREDDEWHFCRIDGAQLIPLSQFGELAVPRLPNPTERIIIYCHHGMRSLRATHWLREHGYTQTQSLRGGIDLWSELVDAAVPRY